LAAGALVVTGAMSAGELTGLAMKMLRAKAGAKIIDSTTQSGGEQDAAQPHRVSRGMARGAQTALE
jgi:hypothetical protein